MSEGLAARAARSTAWSAASQAAQVVLGLGGVALLTPHLAPEDYGAFAMSATVAGIVGVVGDAGLVAALLRRETVDAEAEATAFWLSLAGAAVLATLVFATAPMLGALFADDRITALAAAGAAGFLLAAPGRVSQARLMRALAFRTLAVATTGGGLLGLVAGLWVARRGGGPWSLVAQNLVTLGAQAAALLLLAPIRPRPSLVRAGLSRELGAFGSRLGGFSLAVALCRAGDAPLLGRLQGADALGLTGQAVKLVTVPVQRLLSSATSVFLPAVLELRDDPARQGRAFLRAARVLAVVAAPVSFGIAAVAPELVALLPARWSALAPALQVYACGSFLDVIGLLSVSMLTALGRAEALLRIGLVAVPAGWLAAALGGASGSPALFGVLWHAVGLAMAIGMLVALRDAIPSWTALARALAAPALLGLAMWAVVRLAVRATGTAGLPTGLLPGIATGAVFFVLGLRVLLPSELGELVQLLRAGLARSRAPTVGAPDGG